MAEEAQRPLRNLTDEQVLAAAKVSSSAVDSNYGAEAEREALERGIATPEMQQAYQAVLRAGVSGRQQYEAGRAGFIAKLQDEEKAAAEVAEINRVVRQQSYVESRRLASAIQRARDFEASAKFSSTNEPPLEGTTLYQYEQPRAPLRVNLTPQQSTRLQAAQLRDFQRRNPNYLASLEPKKEPEPFGLGLTSAYFDATEKRQAELDAVGLWPGLAYRAGRGVVGVAPGLADVGAEILKPPLSGPGSKAENFTAYRRGERGPGRAVSTVVSGIVDPIVSGSFLSSPAAFVDYAAPFLAGGVLKGARGPAAKVGRRIGDVLGKASGEAKLRIEAVQAGAPLEAISRGVKRSGKTSWADTLRWAENARSGNAGIEPFTVKPTKYPQGPPRAPTNAELASSFERQAKAYEVRTAPSYDVNLGLKRVFGEELTPAERGLTPAARGLTMADSVLSKPSKYPYGPPRGPTPAELGRSFERQARKEAVAKEVSLNPADPLAGVRSIFGVPSGSKGSLRVVTDLFKGKWGEGLAVVDRPYAQPWQQARAAARRTKPGPGVRAESEASAGLRFVFGGADEGVRFLARDDFLVKRGGPKRRFFVSEPDQGSGPTGLGGGLSEAPVRRKAGRGQASVQKQLQRQLEKTRKVRPSGKQAEAQPKMGRPRVIQVLEPRRRGGFLVIPRVASQTAQRVVAGTAKTFSVAKAQAKQLLKPKTAARVTVAAEEVAKPRTRTVQRFSFGPVQSPLTGGRVSTKTAVVPPGVLVTRSLLNPPFRGPGLGAPQSGGFWRQFAKGSKRTARKFKYAPSVVAIEFNLKGRQRGGLGVGIRPLAAPRRVKRRKK